MARPQQFNPTVVDSINYSTVTERRFVVSKEQIMALPNLRGYWKYSDSVVRFRIKPVDRPRAALAFMPRLAQSVIRPEELASPFVAPPVERQLELPMPQNRRSTHSNELEEEGLEYSQEVSPEIPDGPQFNY